MSGKIVSLDFKFFNKVRNPKQVAIFKQDVDLLLKKPNSTLYDISQYFKGNPKKAISSLKKLYNQNFKINWHPNITADKPNKPRFETWVVPLVDLKYSTFYKIVILLLNRPCHFVCL